MTFGFMLLSRIFITTSTILFILLSNLAEITDSVCLLTLTLKCLKTSFNFNSSNLFNTLHFVLL